IVKYKPIERASEASDSRTGQKAGGTMKFVMTLSCGCLWQGNPATLVVVVSTDDAAADRLLAYGVDPVAQVIRFARVVSSHDMGSSLGAVGDGRYASPSSSVDVLATLPVGSAPTMNSIDVPTTRPPPIGPTNSAVIGVAVASVASTNVASAA